MSATESVIIAAAQSVAKVYVIGAAGYFAVLYPRQSPLLPREVISPFARFCFHVLLIPLVYGTTASSVTPNSMGDYWFVLVGAFVVLIASYGTATLLQSLCIRLDNPRDFYALRIAVTFPNIVALPILIFPSLCSYPVVYNGYRDTTTSDNNVTSMDASALQASCVTRSSTMIFCYFFSWSLAFWTFGYPQLMAAAAMKTSKSNDDNNDTTTADENVQETKNYQNYNKSDDNMLVIREGFAPEDDSKDENDMEQQGEVYPSVDEKYTSSSPVASAISLYRSSGISTNLEHEGEIAQQIDEKTSDEKIQRSSRDGITSPDVNVTECQVIETSRETSPDDSVTNGGTSPQEEEITPPTTAWTHVKQALIQTFTSPGFLALLAGFITGCITPLQSALFDSAGALSFLGSSITTLGSASPPVSTIIVAASLVPPSSFSSARHQENNDDQENDEDDPAKESPIMSDPNYGPRQTQLRQRRQSSLRRIGGSVRRRSSRFLSRVVTTTRSTPEMRRLMLWFILSRLIIAPAVVVGIITGLECGGWLRSIPDLAKLVVIVNSCVPGAQVIVVILKCQSELAGTAAAVAKIYLPSYLLSIITIAAWTSVGLFVTLPDASGVTVCQRKMQGG